MEPHSRGMSGLSTILCLVEVRVIPRTFMLPRHSLSNHVVEALCLQVLQLIRTAGKNLERRSTSYRYHPAGGFSSKDWAIYHAYLVPLCDKHVNILFYRTRVRIPMSGNIDCNSYLLAAFFQILILFLLRFCHDVQAPLIVNGFDHSQNILPHISSDNVFFDCFQIFDVSPQDEGEVEVFCEVIFSLFFWSLFH
jgi:hypothetical protein